MKNTILVTSSNRVPERLTRRLWEALERSGCHHVKQEGSPDVAFARCMALTRAAEVLDEQPERNVVLMVDDDMIGGLDVFEKLIEFARVSQQVTSAAYATQSGHLAACRFRVDGEPQKDDGGNSLWLTGAGALAIPRARLLFLRTQCARFRIYMPSGELRDCVEFTASGARDGEWFAEDYELCRRFGGVRLAPLAVGHMKKTTFWPDEHTLETISKDGAFEHEEPWHFNASHLEDRTIGEATLEPAP